MFLFVEYIVEQEEWDRKFELELDLVLESSRSNSTMILIFASNLTCTHKSSYLTYVLIWSNTANFSSSK